MAEPTLAGRSGENGFWSQISSGLGEGLGKITSQVLPVWAAKELNVQRLDQLNESTYNPNAPKAQPRTTDQIRSTGDSPIQSADKMVLDTTTIMIIGSGLLLAVLVYVIVRKT